MSVRSRLFSHVSKDGYIHRYCYLYGYWREGKKIRCKYLGKATDMKVLEKLGKFSLSALATISGIKNWERRRYWLAQAINHPLTCRQLEAIQFLENNGRLGQGRKELLEEIKKGLKGDELKRQMELYRLKDAFRILRKG
ncbi:hypothetical protein ES702_01725 [subsurface metagenome]